jgi:hypothetical protein
VEAVSPAIAVRLPEPAERACNIEEIESKIHSVMTTLRTEISGIDVTYLSPQNVGAELLNIPTRILGLPYGRDKAFYPKYVGAGKEMTE